MKKIAVVLVALLALAGCANFGTTIPNPVSGTSLYQAELVFDASLKTFTELRGLCAARVLPPVCRTYVIRGRDIIVKAYAADSAARNFIDHNPTLDPISVVSVFTSLVGDFNSTVTALSATK